MVTGAELLAEAQRLRRVPGRSAETRSAAASACSMLETDGADGATHAAALCLAGELHQEAREWGEAVRLFEQAMDLDPGSKAAAVGAAVAKGMLPSGDKEAAGAATVPTRTLESSTRRSASNKKCRRDARALFNSGLLAEERYHRSLTWRSSARAKDGGGEAGMPLSATEMGEMSAHSMEDEITAIASSAGLFEPSLNEVLKALIEEHRTQQERGDSFQADYVMQLYHFKSRQLLAVGGMQAPASTR
eukprot:jgi/Tetstr1/459890/TSEL_005232.t1